MVPQSHRSTVAAIAMLLVLLGCSRNNSVALPSVNDVGRTTLTYPKTHRSDHVDVYHGSKVADPYRWLENPDSPETIKWIKAQNDLTFNFLEEIPLREGIKQRLTELWNFERFGRPRQYGDRYFYTRNDGLQNQSVLYVADSLDAEPRILLEPNEWSQDGTVSLAGWRVSEDGKYVAYGISNSGSDWREWKVLDVDGGHDLSDHLKWIRNSGVSWAPDGQGMYYSRYPDQPEGELSTEINQSQQLYYHQLGTRQDEDRLIYERPDEKEWGFGGLVTEDGQYLIISVWKGTLRKNQVFYKKLGETESSVVELLTGFDAQYEFLGNDGATFFFNTDKLAPLHRVVAIDLELPEVENWREIIPEAAQTLDDINLVGDEFFAEYLNDATTLIKRFDVLGRFLGAVRLPSLGTAGGFHGRRSDTETFYSFTNFSTPPIIYRYDLSTSTSEVFRQAHVDFDAAAYQTTQIFYDSRDGTRVPMFISHRKDLKLHGNNPVILYGYGGFNISLTPHFSTTALVWMEMGGIYAVANLRGGGEYGRQWHEAGTVHNKQNVFDDYIAAARWLVDKKYTRSEKLAVQGGSNGGLLVGAIMTQHPELIGAALPSVGVMDMLRYHKFTIGWMWKSDYGSSDDPNEFNTLLSYSPLHKIKPGSCYPPTLITTGHHDDRVVPGHSFKFAATLQAAQSCPAPILIRIETKAGHGAGKPMTMIIEEAADKLAFLARVLDVGVSERRRLDGSSSRTD